MRPLVFVLIMTFCFSCRKNNIKSGEPVEIYLLKSYKEVPGKCQIDALSAVLQDVATVKNEDIVEYSKTNYQFKLTNSAIEKIKAFADRTPFAVAIDKKVIYYGFFKPGTSGSSCDNSITMDIDRTTENKISLKLGYPSQLQNTSIDDERNNPALILTLQKQGKLK